MVVVFSTKESGEFWRKTQGFLKNRFGKMEMMQRLVRKQGFYTQTQGFNSGAFWSIDVYKCHKLRDMNVCVCVIHLWHFFLHLYSTVIHVCVCVSIIFSYSTVPWTRRGQESWEPKWLSRGFVGGFLVHLYRFARIDYVYPLVNRLQTNVCGHTHSWFTLDFFFFWVNQLCLWPFSIVSC